MTSRAHHNTASSAKRCRPIRLQTYAVIARAVEEGIAYGRQRYNKYHDDTNEQMRMTVRARIDSLTEHIEREVLNALCEVIRFDEETPQ